MSDLFPPGASPWRLRGGVVSDRVPANLEPFVEALGRETAVAFLLEFGGAELYLAERPGANCRLAAGETAEGRARLAKRMGPGMILVPLAKRWIAFELRRQGVANAAIARRVRSNVATVRKWFAEADAKRDQLTLL